METLLDKPKQRIQFSTESQFIKANTIEASYEHLQKDCTIPVFSKDNECTISHVEFIETAYEVAEHIFKGEQINYPSVRVSHAIKGRIPEAISKPANLLLDHERTIYYERMAFLIEIPNLKCTVGENQLALCIGGVRAYNHENLFNRKTEEKFKVFIGFQNKVCCNLCISTDGYKAELRARTVEELGSGIFDLVKSFKAEKFIQDLKLMPNYAITETQFAQLIGKMRMYSLMPVTSRKGLPNLLLTDTQISSVVKDYYTDKNFSRNEDGSLNLWNFLNLLTESNKSSYIDNFLDRSTNSFDLVKHLFSAISQKEYSWYLN
ncbi:MAG: DUF3871 family protein [Bacteroidota bacterium]|nr:DUF3871 family protein [Bacteroidota bacterium]